MEILDKIPCKFDLNALLEKMHIEKESDDAKDFTGLLETASGIARPKVIYDIAYVENSKDDTVEFGNTVFTSHILSVNLDKVERVFPYIITCGRELDEIKIPPDDMFKQFWMDGIKTAALFTGRNYFIEFIKKRYAIKKTASMSPGSGSRDIWPIEQQKLLFSLFGDVEKLIGVKLTDSFLMIPNKTVSGILYPAEVDFNTCKLCPRKVCINRRAPYDEELVKKYDKK